MINHVNNCCGQPPSPRPKYGTTRSPCGRELLTGCGEPLKNTILDHIWGKPAWLREWYTPFRGQRAPQTPEEIEQHMRTGSTGGGFNRELADPAWEWDHSMPIQPYTTEDKPKLDGYNQHPYWPDSEMIAACETTKTLCDQKWFKTITHYPSVGRPFQTASENPKRSKGLAISPIPMDVFSGKGVEQYKYWTTSSDDIGNIKITENVHNKNEHTNTAYPGKYWISWWNGINPGKIKGYKNLNIFTPNIYDDIAAKIKCDTLVPSASCWRIGCQGITFLNNKKRKTILKVSSGEFHSCAMFDDGSFDCWGITLNNVGTVPEAYKSLPIIDINCGLDFTLLTTSSGITGWGRDTNRVLTNIPEKFKTGINELKKLAVGGRHCAALLNNGKLELWGGDTNNRRLRIKPKILLKQPSRDEVVIDGIDSFDMKGTIIPFWGDTSINNRNLYYDKINEWEATIDETTGLQVDPISEEIEFHDIWAGRNHIVGLAKTSFSINVEDLYPNKTFPTLSAGFGSYIRSRLFSWGLGMPGDDEETNPTAVDGHFRQSTPNYFSNILLYYNDNVVPYGKNFISDFSGPGGGPGDQIVLFHLEYNDNFYSIPNTIKLATSSTANHTIFPRKKISSETSYSWFFTHWDPEACKPVPGDCVCRDVFGDPIPGTWCGNDPEIGFDAENNRWKNCFQQPEAPFAYILPSCGVDYYGIMFDGWGDDRFGQLTKLGLNRTNEYYSAPYVNYHLSQINAGSAIQSTTQQNSNVKYAVGYDRSIISVNENYAGEMDTKIYYAGNEINTSCLQTQLSTYGGNETPVLHLSCGYEHNIIVQNPDVKVNIDFPYKGEIDKAYPVSWNYGPFDPEYGVSDQPRVLLRNTANKEEVFYEPEFDLNTSSRLIFDLDVSIEKYNGSTKIQELKFNTKKEVSDSSGSSGIVVNLIGTRGDQRVKPFTGATCDCVWSDWATDSLKIGGHQGTIINHFNFDWAIDARKNDTAFSWLDFNQLMGTGNGHAGGHEQTWRNLETAVTNSLSQGNFQYGSFWEETPNKPKINYYFAPPNMFTHNIIEVPPGRFPSQLSYECRRKYCPGGNNNIIRNWCDPCYQGVTLSGWKGRLGCTGCEYNFNSELCSGCTFNSYGVWVCPDTAPPVRDVYGYSCPSKVFGNILPDLITLKNDYLPDDQTLDEIRKLHPALKNKPIYQIELIPQEDGQPPLIEYWNVGFVGDISKRVLYFSSVPNRVPELKQKPFEAGNTFYFKDVLNYNYSSEPSNVEFNFYEYTKDRGNCQQYSNALNKYNSFGELSTPIEESWPSLNRYFIPRWASTSDTDTKNTWEVKINGGSTLDINSYNEIDYPLVIVPAHGGDIGPKYNMEGYFDTEMWGYFESFNSFFFTSNFTFRHYPIEWCNSCTPTFYGALDTRSRYSKDSADFEYPFNKNLSYGGLWKLGHYPDYKKNLNFGAIGADALIDFYPPPPGVGFDTRSIKYQNLLLNGRNVIEPLCGDTETGCSSCSIPFTGAKTAAWGFDLFNPELIKLIKTIIPELTGNPITDIEIGNINSYSSSSVKNGVWLGIAKDRFSGSDGSIIERMRIMVPIDLKPGETIMFGRGVSIDNESTTKLNGGISYKLKVKGKFNQYPNSKGKLLSGQNYDNYEYRWGRFNDECACNSRLTLDDAGSLDLNDISNDTAKQIISKYQSGDGDKLNDQEKAALLIGDSSTEGVALLKFANCVNPVTYLESGEEPILQLDAVSSGRAPAVVGLCDISSSWPIWEKSFYGWANTTSDGTNTIGGYNCKNGGCGFSISSRGMGGTETIDPVYLYTDARAQVADFWIYNQDCQCCVLGDQYKGSGIRGFWSDWLSNRGYSTFLTSLNNTSYNDDDKDRVGADIPFEASHAQGWLGGAFVNPTDGYWSVRVGPSDTLGDLLLTQWGNDCSTCDYRPYPTTSGTQWSHFNMAFETNFAEGDSTTNFRRFGEPRIFCDGSISQTQWTEVPKQRIYDWNQPYDWQSDEIQENSLPFPRTQNKKKQVLKHCCFGDKYISEPPSAVTEAILPDRYTFNVKKNKYRNLYNAMYRAFNINSQTSTLGSIAFRDWHGDPFNPADYDTRFTQKITPVWADYFWASENLVFSACGDGYDWFNNIMEWRHRRWDLPLFVGVNRDNLGTFFINDPSPNCYPETCAGLELVDTSNTIGGGVAYKFGWNHRKYDCISAQAKIDPESLKWVESTRGQSPVPRACSRNCDISAMPPKLGTMYSMNNILWFNCAYNYDIYGIRIFQDRSRWNPYYYALKPGYTSNRIKYNAAITSKQWYK